MIREEALYVLHLRDQPRELAIKGDEMRSFDVVEDEVDVLVEISTIDLHRPCR